MARRSAVLLLLVACASAPPFAAGHGARRVEARAVPPSRSVELATAVLFRGDPGPALDVARVALERVLDTHVGHKARELIETGVLPGPLTIEVNARGDNFTRYRVTARELTETIVFDPSSRPLVDTESGRLAALPETVLAHELGHAVFKLTSEAAVIQAVENPVREQMGVPRRTRF